MGRVYDFETYKNGLSEDEELVFEMEEDDIAYLEELKTLMLEDTDYVGIHIIAENEDGSTELFTTEKRKPIALDVIESAIDEHF